MRAIVMVLTSFAICAAFVIFFAAFTQIPLLLLGIFVIVTTSNLGRRKKPVAPAAESDVDFASFDDE